MPGFKLTRFSGKRPRVPEHLLASYEATIAENCDFAYGELRHTKGGLQMLTMANSPKSVYTDDGTTFYSWDKDIDAVRSPLANDTNNRLYYSGDGGIRVTNRLGTQATGGPPAVSYLVGVPRPTVAPVLSAPAVAEGATARTVSVVYTFVNTYGEEGPASAPSIVTTGVTSTISVQTTKNASSSYAPINEIRVYRTGTGTTIASYFYAGTINVTGQPDGTYTFSDNVPEAMLGEVLSSTNSYPPDTGLQGLMSLPNGILCAWKGNEIHFSEAYRPWSWPPSYVKTTRHAIVGGIAAGSGAVITTRGNPYLISGVSPDAMTAMLLNVDQPGVSKWAIAVADGAVIYASHDGLVTLNGATASLAQGGAFFTRENWRQAYAAGLATMRFAVWDGRLVIYSPTALFTPFMIRFDEADGSLTDLTGLVAACSFTNLLTDQLYYVSGNKMYQFNGGLASVAKWRSGELVVPRPVNFGTAQLLCDGTWTIELWAYVLNPATNEHEYQLMHSHDSWGGLETYRLPAGYEARRYRVVAYGNGRLREIRFATSNRDLASL